jgi:hypothetical protein
MTTDSGRGKGLPIESVETIEETISAELTESTESDTMSGQEVGR